MDKPPTEESQQIAEMMAERQEKQNVVDSISEAISSETGLESPNFKVSSDIPPDHAHGDHVYDEQQDRSILRLPKIENRRHINQDSGDTIDTYEHEAIHGFVRKHNHWKSRLPNSKSLSFKDQQESIDYFSGLYHSTLQDELVATYWGYKKGEIVSSDDVTDYYKSIGWKLNTAGDIKTTTEEATSAYQQGFSPIEYTDLYNKVDNFAGLKGSKWGSLLAKAEVEVSLRGLILLNPSELSPLVDKHMQLRAKDTNWSPDDFARELTELDSYRQAQDLETLPKQETNKWNVMRYFRKRDS